MAIDSLIRISDDGMTASLQWRATDDDSTPPSLEDVIAMLNDAGVVEGIDQKSIQRVLDMKQSRIDDGEPPSGIVARGREMQRGSDASFEFQVEDRRQTGELLSDGTMDYHKQYVTAVVETGDLIAKKTLATEGRPGRTVRGDEIPAEPGSDRSIQAGENIEVSPDGLSLTAACNGIVMRDEDTIRVVTLFEVNGDVEFSTGDLCFDRCGVHVKGSVRSTFSVLASGSMKSWTGTCDLSQCAIGSSPVQRLPRKPVFFAQ